MIECCPLCGSPEIATICETCDREVWTSAGRPGRERLSGWRLRDYDAAVAVLAQARTSQGLSLADVARRTGGSRGSLSEALRGKHELGGWRLFNLVDALGYNLALIPRGPADNGDAPSARPVRP